jgi:PAS domain S-box-containing protein
LKQAGTGHYLFTQADKFFPREMNMHSKSEPQNKKKRIGKLLAKKLKESEEKFRFIAENTNDVIWTLDLETLSLTYVTPSVTKLSGYTAEEHLKKSMSDIIEPQSLKKVMQTILESLEEANGQTDKKEIARRVEWQEYHKDGYLVWVEAEASFIRDNRGKPIGVLGISRNISERKKAEAELKKRNVFIETVIDSLPIALSVLKWPGGEMMFSNKQVKKLFEWDTKSISDLDEVFNKVFPDPVYRESVGKRIISGMQSGDPSQMVWENEQIITGTGKQKTITVNAIPIYDQNMMIIVSQDNTDRKEYEAERLKLEAQLRQSQKMESIGTLAGGIAHDFNNILFPITGYSEMLLQDLPPDSPLRGNLEKILMSAKRARDIVRQILSFSYQTEKEVKNVEVGLIINEILTLIRSSLPSTIEVGCHIPCRENTVIADPTHIHQIAMNLITNAYHAMEEKGGRLDVSLSQKYLTGGDLTHPSMTPGLYVCLTVSDTGTGIESEILEKIFDPYFTTKGQGKGTGLGLSVVHGIVRSYKGDILVDSRPGNGTTVNVYLPLVNPTGEVRESSSHFELKKGKGRVLLVDDEEDVLCVEHKMLELLGYEVTGQKASQEALTLFRKSPQAFDLIITDMTMPKMTGIQLAREIKKVREDIPIIICSGFSEHIDMKKAGDPELQGFVSKPVLINEIAQVVGDILGKN